MQVHCSSQNVMFFLKILPHTIKPKNNAGAPVGCCIHNHAGTGEGGQGWRLGRNRGGSGLTIFLNNFSQTLKTLNIALARPSSVVYTTGYPQPGMPKWGEGRGNHLIKICRGCSPTPAYKLN